MGGGGVHERESERKIMESTDLHHAKQSLIGSMKDDWTRVMMSLLRLTA